MDNKVTNEDFVMILITSLPESWDNYTSSYLGSSGNKPTLSSHKLITILMEEDQCCKGHNSDPAGTSYRQSKIKEKEPESPLGTQMWNAIIATRRVICPKIVGQKVEEKKAKDQRAGKGQIDQIRHRKQTQI